jgi:hypothetical protein
MEAARCWCGDIAKVKETIDFSYTMGRKFSSVPIFNMIHLQELTLSRGRRYV